MSDNMGELRISNPEKISDILIQNNYLVRKISTVSFWYKESKFSTVFYGGKVVLSTEIDYVVYSG